MKFVYYFYIILRKFFNAIKFDKKNKILTILNFREFEQSEAFCFVSTRVNNMET